MKEKLIAKLLNCFIATTEKNNLTMATASDAVQQCNNRKTPNGFTLIELIVVTALIGIVSAIGTVGLVDFTRTAKLNSAANELITTLHVAKSNALSQVKDPTLCASPNVLDGYKVAVNACTTYDLYMVCSGTDKSVMKTKSLPNNIAFTNTAPASFFFPILKGGALGSSTVTATGYGKTRCISVNLQGVISQPSVCPASLPCLTPTPTPTGAPTPTPPSSLPPLTCDMGVSVTRSGLDAACASYCGTFIPSVTCTNQVTAAGTFADSVLSYTTCVASVQVTVWGNLVCEPPGTTTCTCL